MGRGYSRGGARTEGLTGMGRDVSVSNSHVKDVGTAKRGLYGGLAMTKGGSGTGPSLGYSLSAATEGVGLWQDLVYGCGSV